MLQIIGAGFGRTGTLSLKTALEQLGLGPCYHMEDAFARPLHARRWRLAGEGRPPDWERLLHGFQAIVDWPGCSFYTDLLERYPTARVILTVRDPERWYASVAATLHPVMQRFPLNRAGTLVPLAGEVPRMLNTLIWQGVFDGRFADRAHAIAVFNRHNRSVIERVPAGQLLVYDIRQGWGPLCRFLDVAPPAGAPFPHANDPRAYWRRVRRLTAAVYLGLAAAAAAGWSIFHRPGRFGRPGSARPNRTPPHER